jgi:hypothetical protein
MPPAWQAAISRIEQALDQPTQQAIRTAAETATLSQVLAEVGVGADD